MTVDSKMAHSHKLEIQFLLSCLRAQNASEFNFEALTRSKPDWEWIVKRSMRLGIAPLVYRSLKENSIARFIPKSIMDQSKAWYLGYHSKNTLLYQKLIPILGIFSEHHIPVILLKGAVLAKFIYSEIALRPMNDLDLLVPVQDLTRAENRLQELGYTPNERNHSKEWYRKYHHHLVPYLSPDQSLSVEIHHHILPMDSPVFIPVDDLWEHVQPAKFSSIPCLIFKPEFFLLHLCLHLSLNDTFRGQLRALRDIAEVLRSHQGCFRWSEFLRMANLYKIDKYVYYALWIANQIAKAEVPLTILHALRSSIRLFPFEDRIFKHLIYRSMVMGSIERPIWYSWVLRDTCTDLLSSRGRGEKFQSIIQKFSQRYRNFSSRHSPGSGRFGLLNQFVLQPMSLVRRAIGWPPSHKKLKD